MSVGRKTVQYSAAAAIVSIAIIAASFMYLGLPNLTQSSYQGPQSVLAIQLTDPPHVPALTTSLNLTYSSLDLLVGEPTGTPGQFDPKTVTLTPSGGSATLDLLKLQNVSKTIATASLPNGSVIYSVTLTVTSIKIDVNKTISDVSLASGGSTFSVTMASPSGISGTSVALLQLNPVVVNTPTGYQLIPSAVGVVRHSNGGGEDKVGSEQQLSNDDHKELDHAQGAVASSLIHLSVSENITTITVRINNTGNIHISLNAIGIEGNFTLAGKAVCPGENSDFAKKPMSNGAQVATEDASTTTTTTNTLTTEQHCDVPDHDEQVVFVPVIPGSSTTATTTTTTVSHACTAGAMTLATGDKENSHDGGLTLSPGQCVELTFTGKLSFGHFVIVPSTAPGQTFTLNVFASNGANEQQGCTMAHGHDSCDNQHSDNQHNDNK